MKMTRLHSDPNLEVFHAEAEFTIQRAYEEAQLIFMDPPFNCGEKYLEWNDSLPRKEFRQHLARWCEAAANQLKASGSLWVHVPDEWAADVVVICRDELDMHMENWIVWHYRFGQHQPNRFIRSKCHGLWFSNDGQPKVNRRAALVPSDRATIYGDIRTLYGTNPGKRMDLDVWGFERFWGRVQGNNKERRSLHRNQLPEVYLDRIIRVLTDEGDLIVDPFCGSGTTATVARSLERRAITGDITEAYCRSAVERIVEIGAIR